MKNVIVVFFLSFSLLIFSSVNAQILPNEIDALRYSSLFPNGTARYLSMGGAFGAVGADFSTLSSNPAGIALYRSSEFTITPSFFNGNTSSDYLGNTNSDNKYNFALGNVGFVFTGKAKNSKAKGFKYFQFGFGINRTADFNNRVYSEGFNSKSSMMTDYTNAANSDKYGPSNLNPWDTQLAYQTYLLNTLPNDSTSYTSPLYNGNVLQRYRVTTSGSSNEAVVSLGANYNNKLYIGGTIGIPYFNYTEHSDYSETNTIVKDSVQDFHRYDQLSENGVGINVKFGLIYRVTDWLRIGAAVNSPSFYRVNRTYTRDFTSDLFNGNSYYFNSPNSSFDYNLQTPAHYMGSAAFIIGKYGLIDVDYEYVDYSTMKLRDPSNNNIDYSIDYSSANQTIKDIYQGQSNIRVGGELRLDPFAIRLGFDYSTSPFKNTNYQEVKSISAGLGYVQNQYFVDLGFMHTFYNSEYYFYNPQLVTPTINTISTNTLSLTIGYRF